MDPRGGARDLSRGESVEGTVAAMRKESSVKRFITIREMERRQSQAHDGEEGKDHRVEEDSTSSQGEAFGGH